MNRRFKKHLKMCRDGSKSGRNAKQTQLTDIWKTEEVQKWLDKKKEKHKL